MEIAIVTDEVEPDVFGALESAGAWGVRRFEIRKIEGKRVPEIPSAVIERLLQRLPAAGAAITALSPGLFKKAGALLEEEGLQGASWWEDRGLYERYRRKAFEALARTFDLAERFSAAMVILFSPEVPARRGRERCPARIVELFREAAAMAEERRLTLLLENDIGCWADTGENSRRLLEAVERNNLKMNWDPANAYLAGEVPFPLGYEYVKGCIGNVHVKDAKKTTPPFSQDYEPLGAGDIDWSAQVRALKEDGYAGHLCIETHSQPLKEKSYQNLCALRRILERLKDEGKQNGAKH